MWPVNGGRGTICRVLGRVLNVAKREENALDVRFPRGNEQKKLCGYRRRDRCWGLRLAPLGKGYNLQGGQEADRVLYFLGWLFSLI